MKKSSDHSTAQEFVNSIKNSQGVIYELRLYVAGMTPQSVKAITNLKKICKEYLTGRYNLEIVDIYQQSKIADAEQIVAVPLLVKLYPEPIKKMIGDLSNRDRVLRGLGITKS